MAQRADTLPPQRPRLDIEIPPEFQRRSGKAGLWVAGLLSLVIAGGAMYTLSQSAETPPLSAEQSADVKAVLPEPTREPEQPAAAVPASDETADEAMAKADDDANATAATEDSPSAPETGTPIAAPQKPAPSPVSRPTTTAAKKPTTTSKSTTPPTNKTTKVKKTTKPASKTIVRDAPF